MQQSAAASSPQFVVRKHLSVQEKKIADLEVLMESFAG